MTAPYANANGIQITSARITRPRYMAWHGDVALAQGVTLTGDVLLTIGNLVLQGFAFRTAAFAGARGVRVAGGHGGWLKTVAPQSYEAPGAVTAGLVLGDVAISVGERLELSDPSLVLGDFWIRERCKASRVLRQILGDTWWIDDDGVTRDSERNDDVIDSPFQVIEYTPGMGRFIIATEDLKSWAPGRTFSTPVVPVQQTVSSVTIILDNKGSARLEVLANTADTNAGDRIYEDLRELIREDFPTYTFLGLYEYSVDAVGSGTVDASPTDTSLGLPPITMLTQTLPLMTATLRDGDLVRVRFVNGNPARPEVCSAPATSPSIIIGDDSPSPIGRVGDNVNDGYLVLTDPSTAPNGQVDSYYPGTPAGASAADSRKQAIITAGGSASVLPMANGKIDGGSAQVQSG